MTDALPSEISVLPKEFAEIFCNPPSHIKEMVDICNQYTRFIMGIEKQGVINDQTPEEKQKPLVYAKFVKQCKQAGVEINREDHLTKRLSDKVQETTDGSRDGG